MENKMSFRRAIRWLKPYGFETTVVLIGFLVWPLVFMGILLVG